MISGRHQMRCRVWIAIQKARERQIYCHLDQRWEPDRPVCALPDQRHLLAGECAPPWGNDAYRAGGAFRDAGDAAGDDPIPAQLRHRRRLWQYSLPRPAPNLRPRQRLPSRPRSFRTSAGEDRLHLHGGGTRSDLPDECGWQRPGPAHQCERQSLLCISSLPMASASFMHQTSKAATRSIDGVG